jgi:hypothetical protein
MQAKTTETWKNRGRTWCHNSKLLGFRINYFYIKWNFQSFNLFTFSLEECHRLHRAHRWMCCYANLLTNLNFARSSDSLFSNVLICRDPSSLCCLISFRRELIGLYFCSSREIIWHIVDVRTPMNEWQTQCPIKIISINIWIRLNCLPHMNMIWDHDFAHA